MHPVQSYTLMASQEGEVLSFHQYIKRKVMYIGLKEVEFAVVDCIIPCKEELIVAVISEPME